MTRRGNVSSSLYLPRFVGWHYFVWLGGWWLKFVKNSKNFRKNAPKRAYLYHHYSMRKLIIILAGLTAMFSACSFNADETVFTQDVEIALPAYPAELPRLGGWLLVTEQDGAKRERFVPAASRAVCLTLSKNSVAAVLLYPLTDSDDTALISFFSPAGCVYPVSFSADWKSGFEAEVLFELLTCGEQSDAMRSLVEQFNWKRLHTEIAAISHPWNMDKAKFKTTITLKSFTKNVIKEQKTADVSISEQITQGVMYGSYVPDALLNGETFAFCAGRENLVFDGTNIFLVYKPEGPAVAGQAYSLALMPISLYTYYR
jgi:hypothetical protein